MDENICAKCSDKCPHFFTSQCKLNECEFGGDIANDCEDCAYSSDYHFDAKTGDCIRREVI